MKAIKFKKDSFKNNKTVLKDTVLLINKSFENISLEKNSSIEIITTLFKNDSNLNDEYIIGDIHDLLDDIQYLFFNIENDNSEITEEKIINFVYSKLDKEYKDLIQIINI